MGTKEAADIRVGNVLKIGYPDLRTQIGGFPYP